MATPGWLEVQRGRWQTGTLKLSLSALRPCFDRLCHPSQVASCSLPLCEPVDLEHDSRRSSSRDIRSDISCAEDFLRTAFPWRRCSKLRPSSHNPYSTFYIFLYFLFIYFFVHSSKDTEVHIIHFHSCPYLRLHEPQLTLKATQSWTSVKYDLKTPSRN